MTKKPVETMETTTNGTGISVDLIEETQAEILPPVTMEGDEASSEGVGQSADLNQIEATPEDCEVLYGVIMETAHGMFGTKKGKGHRGLPEDRRKSQGKLLFNICQRYNITIPTEFEIVILGGAIIADWQYMTVKEDSTQSGGESVEAEIDNSDEE